MNSILLLSVFITATVADYAPDCTSCDYNNGIGYVKSYSSCAGFFVCFKNADGEYDYAKLCCPPGLTFDEEHLTCDKIPDDYQCVDTRVGCPNVTTPTDICNYTAAYEPNQFMWGGEVMTCPPGTIWSQANCSCIHDGTVPPCNKILHFAFEGNYDSTSCNNFAKGEPQNDPSVDDGVLCLNGKNQSVAVAYLDNYFAWNPIADTFTLCFWLAPGYSGQTAGVFSTNCYFTYSQESLFEAILDYGTLKVNVGGVPVDLGVTPPTDDFSKLCITYNNGTYLIYYNGELKNTAFTSPMPINSQSAVSLGYIKGKNYFDGYIDDFCFWTSVLDEQEILDCFNKGSSNDFFAGAAGPS